MDVPVPFGTQARSDRAPPSAATRLSRGVSIRGVSTGWTPASRDRRPRDLLWTLLVCAADVVLRRWYGVREFTNDPSCLLRLALAPAPRAVTLSDSTRVAAGETVAMLHIWNEQIPRFGRDGPDLCWATDLRHRLLGSFRELARHIENDPAFRDIRGIHACVTFGSRRRRAQIRRAAARFGFDLIDDGAAPEGLHERGEDFLIWAFTRAFNPTALRRQPFRRDRTEVWISRRKLLELYL